MKLFKTLILAAALALPHGAYADSHTSKTYTDHGGDRVTVDSGGTFRMKPGSIADLSGPTFSTALTGNPLVQMSVQDVTTASANADVVVLASATGAKIYPGVFSIMASGTAAGATSVIIQCSGGTKISTIPIAMLVNQIPVGPYSSSVITNAAALASGCPSGEAVYVSNNGTLTTTTDLILSLPYTVQK